MFFLQPAGEAAATRTTPGFAIGSTPFHFLGGYLPGWHWGLEYWSQAADDDVIASARSTGMTVMHIMLPLFEGPLGQYDEVKLQKLDHFLDSAYKANVYVMPSFIQAYSETLIAGNTEYPYYHPRSIEGIIKDPALRQAFKNRIAALVNRTNTINNRPYKNDPTILAWIICDEPISAPFNYPNGVPQVTLEELTDWFQETASFIKNMDSNHLVTVWSQPAIQAFFGGTSDYLQALGIPEFDFMYTEDADLSIVSGLTQGYGCTGQTPQYMLDQFLPGKPVAYHPAFTSGCWDTDVICNDNFATQATDLNLAIPEYFEVGGNAVLIENWGTDLYSSVPGWAQCRTYTDSVPAIVTVAQAHSSLVNPDGYPIAPLGYVSVIYGLNVDKSGSSSGTVTSDLGGINCGNVCSKAFTQGSVVTLTAQADAGSTFTGWSGGGCSGIGTCVVIMNGEKTVTARFDYSGSVVTLLSPNGGNISAGSPFLVEWEASPGAISFNLSYSLDNGVTWTPVQVAPGTAKSMDNGNTPLGSFTGTTASWNVPLPTKNKTKCLVKITAFDASNKKLGTDKSDGPFTIEVLSVITPSSCTSGQVCRVEWTKAPAVNAATAELSYSLNNGTTWKKILAAISGADSGYDWTPTVTKTKTKCKVKLILKDAAGKKVGTDISDGVFTISR